MDIRTLCLGVLTLGDATGYEIKKMFEDGPFSHFYGAGFGSIYPALNRLTSEKLVSCTQLAQDKRPDKKVYRITPEGRAEFAVEIVAPPGPDRLRSEFLVTITFSQFLSAAQLGQVVDDRIEFHHQKLEQMARMAQSCSDNPVRRFTVGYGEALHKAAAEYLSQNRDMLEAPASRTSDAAE